MCLKNALHKYFVLTNVVANHNMQLLVQRLFWSPYGCDLCPDAIIRIFGEKYLKNALYNFFLPTKVATKQNMQLLCNVTFFDILHHYGVIAASLICSVEKVLCRLTEQIFYFLDYTEYRESIASVRKIDIEISLKIHFLRHADFKRIIFGMSVCLSVCLSVCGHHNSKNNWASSTKFGMRSYMIKILVGIAYEQNRPTGVASALRAQFGFLGEKCLKNALYKFFFRQKLLQITIHNFWCKNVFDRSTGVASVLMAQFGFLVKSALKVRCTKFSYQTKVVTNQYPLLLCNVTFFDILHRYGVIAASQICSVSRKYCDVLRNRFFS